VHSQLDAAGIYCNVTEGWLDGVFLAVENTWLWFDQSRCISLGCPYRVRALFVIDGLPVRMAIGAVYSGFL